MTSTFTMVEMVSRSI